MIDENKWGVHAATVMTSLLVEGGATRSILNLNSFHSHEIYIGATPISFRMSSCSNGATPHIVSNEERPCGSTCRRSGAAQS